MKKEKPKKATKSNAEGSVPEQIPATWQITSSLAICQNMMQTYQEEIDNSIIH
jgi:hypothetical protein